MIILILKVDLTCAGAVADSQLTACAELLFKVAVSLDQRIRGAVGPLIFIPDEKSRNVAVLRNVDYDLAYLSIFLFDLDRADFRRGIVDVSADTYAGVWIDGLPVDLSVFEIVLGGDQVVHQNTREIIRRDRNHPCVLMWEPILNETRYPKDFALQALQITKEEYPYPGRPVAAADMNSEGVKENYDVLYDWADNIGKNTLDTDKCIFTREWGEYVDDWYAHNAINRAARPWGEKAMLTAAMSLADTYGMMFRGQRQFIGGCQWHPFDHQRGYHPDAYLGGIYDAFRQKKYAFEMFRSQSSVSPMVFIANEMTQYSDNDVVVFSNCDSVRLTAFEGEKSMTLPVVHEPAGTPHVPVVFKGFWDSWKARSWSYTQRNWQKVSLLAEGIKDGKVVCSEKKMPSRRSTKIRLYADEMGKNLVADGSDFIVVVAEITDDNGNVRRNAREYISFTVEGEGTIIDDGHIMANPRIVEWGSAPVLIRASHQAGTIRIIAQPTYQGVYAPSADTLEIQSLPYEGKMCYQVSSNHHQKNFKSQKNMKTPHSLDSLTEEERRKNLEEVEKQQQDFGPTPAGNSPGRTRWPASAACPPASP